VFDVFITCFFLESHFYVLFSSSIVFVFIQSSQYQTPITTGQLRDAGSDALSLARRRVFVLQQRLAPLVLRRTAEAVLTRALPPKHEVAIWCALSPLQAQCVY
jgi:SNF2 family DNA or RNA helicase